MSSNNNSQQQQSQWKAKYDSEVKKNNSLLKMNSNLMRQNEAYLNCFNVLKKWGIAFIMKFGEGESMEDLDESCIDIEEEGEEFIGRITQLIDSKMEEFNSLLMEKQQLAMTIMAGNSPLPSPTNQMMTTQNVKLQQQQQQQQQQCNDCNRWKQLYIKEAKETSKLQKLIDDSTVLNTQKQLNFTKLKDDTLQLLQSYLILYRKELQVTNDNPQTQLKEQLDQSSKVLANHITHNKETVRPKDKIKQKRPNSNSGHKNKKQPIKNQVSKQPNPFSKQKTSRKDNIKYAIELSPPKPLTQQQNQKPIQNLPSNLQQTELSKCLKGILSSYAQLSKNLGQQNNQLKEQLKDLSEILNIYRERERNQILFR